MYYDNNGIYEEHNYTYPNGWEGYMVVEYTKSE